MTRSPHKLKAAVEAMKVGNGMEPGVIAGPADQRRRGEEGRRAHRRRAEARRHGGDRRQAPRSSAAISSSRRCWRTCRTTRLIFREETFGPVAPLFRFKTEEEAIQLANDTEFGLAAYFYARDVGRIFRVGRGAGIRHDRHQRGHHLDRRGAVRRHETSGLGREGSKYGIEDYLEIKYLAVGGIGT